MFMTNIHIVAMTRSNRALGFEARNRNGLSWDEAAVRAPTVQVSFRR